MCVCSIGFNVMGVQFHCKCALAISFSGRMFVAIWLNQRGSLSPSGPSPLPGWVEQKDSHFSEVSRK